MKLTNEEIQKIRDIRIPSILGINDMGRRISVRCPFHRERTASCYIYSDNSFHCFGCNTNGQGAIDFVMALGFTFQESLSELIKYI